MTEVTTNGIVKWTNSDPASIVKASQAQGDSVELALSKRERFDFVWANSAERTAQTGMVQGSRGYQVDTKTDYIYDNSTWRLLLSHVEYTATSATINNASGGAAGVFSQDAVNTTNTAFTVAGVSGAVTIVDPGVYAVSSLTALGAAATGRSFLDLGVSSNVVQRVSINTGEDMGSISMPNVRTTTANVVITFNIFQTTGSNRTVTTRIRITRMG